MQTIAEALLRLTSLVELRADDGRWCRIGIAEAAGQWQVWEAVGLGVGDEPSAALLAQHATLAEAKQTANRLARARRRLGFFGPKQQRPLAPLTRHWQPLIDELRAWRRQEAAARGLRPYQILHDRHLAELIKQWPTSLEGLVACPGWGGAKLAKYGEAVLAILARHADLPRYHEAM